MAVLLAGLPTSVPGATVNRLCGSSLEAAIAGAAARSRPATPIIVAGGGVESMSRAPWVLLKPERAFPAGHETLHSTTLGWRMVNPRDARAVDDLARRERREAGRASTTISREAQDAFALRSHQHAAAAWDDGFYDAGSCPCPAPTLERDEGIRADTVAREARQAQARLPSRTARSPPATPRRSTTAPRAVLLGDEAAPRPLGREPLARIVAPRRRTASTPTSSASRPVEAANQALERAGIGWDDVDVVELNEAFASQSLACLAELARARPREGQPQRRRDRDRPPARRLRRAHPRHARPRAARAAAAATASPRSASASARAWPW